MCKNALATAYLQNRDFSLFVPNFQNRLQKERGGRWLVNLNSAEFYVAVIYMFINGTLLTT